MRWKEDVNLPLMPCIIVAPTFRARIMNEALPANFKTPMTKKFDKVGDSHKHIRAYLATIMLMGSNDFVMCRAFFSMLRGIAQW